MQASALVDGIALAATIAEDRHAAAARAGLRGELAAAVGDRVAGLSGPGRDRALRAIAGGLRPGIDGSHEPPPRAAQLLAPDAPRELGARWIAAASPPRAGFRASTALRAQLRRLAGPRVVGDPTIDRGEGRRVLCAALRSAGAQGDDALRERALAVLEAEESAAVLALALLPADAGDEPDLARALARAALDAGAGASLTIALGAMARGTRGGGRGRWERAGREIAELEERACRG